MIVSCCYSRNDCDNFGVPAVCLLHDWWSSPRRLLCGSRQFVLETPTAVTHLGLETPKAMRKKAMRQFVSATPTWSLCTTHDRDNLFWRPRTLYSAISRHALRIPPCAFSPVWGRIGKFARNKASDVAMTDPNSCYECRRTGAETPTEVRHFKWLIEDPCKRSGRLSVPRKNIQREKLAYLTFTGATGLRRKVR